MGQNEAIQGQTKEERGMEKNQKKEREQSFLGLSASQGPGREGRIEEMFTQAIGDEDVSLREENVKHYDLGANRRQAVAI